MSLNHPTGWSATCDMCFTEIELDDPIILTEEDALAELFDVRGWHCSDLDSSDVFCPECIAVIMRRESAVMGARANR